MRFLRLSEAFAASTSPFAHEVYSLRLASNCHDVEEREREKEKERKREREKEKESEKESKCASVRREFKTERRRRSHIHNHLLGSINRLQNRHAEIRR